MKPRSHAFSSLSARLIVMAVVCAALFAPAGFASPAAAAPSHPSGGASSPAVANAITTYPFFENFEEVTPPALPSGWTTLHNGADNSAKWVTVNDFAAQSYPNEMGIVYHESALNDWFFTPALNFKANKFYAVDFYYVGRSDYTNEAMEVRIGTAPTAAAMAAGPQIFNSGSFSAVYGSSQLYHGTGVQFSPDADGVYYVGWHAYSPAETYGIVVDDITVSEVDTTISTFPTSENFDGVTAPASPAGWRVRTATPNSQPWVNTHSTLAPSQPNAMKAPFDTTYGHNTWLLTPRLALQAGSIYHITFYYYILGSGGATGKLELYNGTYPTATAMAGGKKLWGMTAGASEDTVTVDFAPLTTGGYYLGWHAANPPGSVAIYVDNLQITREARIFLPSLFNP